jgi:hypothetical protein
MSAPGLTIQAAIGGGAIRCPQTTSQFAAWLLHWVDTSLPGATDSSSNSSNTSTSGETPPRSSKPSATATGALLRQLWALLQSRYYSPWMLWFAAALNRAGETQLACEAAAQGMLPHCCHFWDVISIKQGHAACFEAVLPVLAHSGEYSQWCGQNTSLFGCFHQRAGGRLEQHA